MSHHPPDWFMDYDEVDDAICGRASIHLFGHKHRQRVLTDYGFIRFSAGALNPDRNEAAWDPAYNLIQLDVSGEHAERKLLIEAHLLKWQVNPEGYVPKQNPQGGYVFKHSILVPRQESATRVSDLFVLTDNRMTDGITTSAADVEAAMSDEETRDLIFRFWNLTSSQRREIALSLGLITDSELSLPEPERYGRALLRAGEKNLIGKVAQAMSRLEN
jgi:hypothetical protein